MWQTNRCASPILSVPYTFTTFSLDNFFYIAPGLLPLNSVQWLFHCLFTHQWWRCMNQFAAVSCHGRQHQPQQRCEVDAHKSPFLGTPPQIHHCRCPGSGRGSQIPRLHRCKCISDWTKGYMVWQLRVKIHIHLHALCILILLLNQSCVQSIVILYLWKEHTFPFSYRSLRFARNASSVISSSRMKSGCPNSAGSESAIVVLLQEENGVVHCKRDVLSADNFDTRFSTCLTHTIS